ncbi:Xanthine/uracil/vitamin C transporter [Candidatus Koribacter versatilis Ellin345]|uniref:Xanthine/uracil/vitamin C transporter n=1 Tax=Koribacter versatilis (strain Ellin345) TaxID=204669 RepID=Q1IPA4_KORVE|nr:NCS2 family permease [Candidatus Koribacter versatilis]ABF41296.1 Xanthine/uracil/vitamin C transporter [Candidatus Koribacter versatilis Ellin345]
MNGIARYFQFEQRNATLGREVIAGLTTFTTMSYIVVVNPAILSAAGIPAGPSFVATVLAAVFGCFLMGLYANRPFAIAPYMGENAFIAFTVCKMLGYKWETALAAIFIAGVAFILLTVFKLRQWIVEGVPTSLRYSFAVGIGFFLTFIGLNQTGLVVLGVDGAPVKAGHLTSHLVLLAIFGFVLISILVIRKFPGAILVGILVTAVVAFATKIVAPPQHIVSLPPSVMPIVWKLDFRGALSWGAFPIVLTIFIMAFVDTMGTLIGLSARAGFLDKDGNLPQIERPMLVDALTTCFSPAIGTTTSGAFVESATGIEAGGRTGFTVLVTGACFLLTLFFAPFVGAIPPQAYGPALIIVGLFMLSPITHIDFNDFTESIPAFATVMLMSFTFNIAIGISAGFVLYPICKLVSGRIRELKPGLWVLSALSLLFFVFYPYS